MKRQTIIWTALPNGLTKEGKLKLSIFITPRLETKSGEDTFLGEFQDFLQWPSKNIDFSVKFQLGTIVKDLSPDKPLATHPLPEQKVWEAIFKTSTLVQSYQFDDYSDRIIQSYPVTQVMSFLKNKYQDIAISSPIQFPSVQNLLKDSNSFKQIAFDDEDEERGKRADLDQILKRDKAIPPQTVPDPSLDFLQFKLFHEPHNEPQPVNPSDYPKWDKYKRANIEKPNIDFHQMVSSLAEFPRLMRRMGLVVDLLISLPTEIILPSEFTIWVVPKWTSISLDLPTVNVTPKTHCTTDFRPISKPGGNDIGKGMLKLTDPNTFDIVQVNVDGAAHKVMNFAYNITRSVTLYRYTFPDSVSVPSLQSAGLSVVKVGRAMHLVKDLEASTKNNSLIPHTDGIGTVESSNAVDLFAEDLVKGYRIDVFDSLTNNWHSLCKRNGNYNFVAAGFEISEKPDSEGCITMGTTESAVPPSPSIPSSLPNLYLSESLFRWEGWSLCVPRPVTRLNTKNNKPDKYVPETDTEFKMISSFSVVKGSLPSLRFGNKYGLRARVVDLAGNSITLEEANDIIDDGTSIATPLQSYLRFEPISAPAIVLRNSIEKSPGESPERVVIRTFNDTLEKDMLPISKTEISERHISPPLCAPSLAETHKKFDNATGLKKNAYSTIVRREGTFEVTEIKDLDSGLDIDIGGNEGVEIIDKVKVGGHDIEPKQVIKYPVHHEQHLILPYLPDPLSKGAVFIGLPHSEDHLQAEVEWNNGEVPIFTNLTGKEDNPIRITKVSFDSTDVWPKTQSFLLVVGGIRETDTSEDPKWDANLRTLAVFLPQATIAKVRLSLYFGFEDLQLMGIWKWIEESADPTKDMDKLEYYARQGRHWMITPFRDILLIHAVQQPLGSPKFVNLKAERHIGETFALLTDNPVIHVKSTGKIDILAEWNEIIDEITDDDSLDGKKVIQRKAHAFEMSINYPKLEDLDSSRVIINHRHEFGDTIYRQVKYTIIATTRFQEYFDDMEVFNGFTRKSLLPQSLSILNSARPPTPKVLYVIPTFRWARKADTLEGRIESKRSGGGLRVYLELPWFSSGDGEQLGVVLGTKLGLVGDIMDPPPDQLKTYITQWGSDPLSKSEMKSFVPSNRDFTRSVITEDGLTIDELAKSDMDGWSISVVGHDVGYDPIRQLRYCDIEITNSVNNIADSSNVYYPFLRLALARYQPNSVKEKDVNGNDVDVKLSRIVLSDFIQLTPARTASVTVNPDNAKQFTVMISGIEGTHSEANEVEVTVERRDPLIESDLGWIKSPEASIINLGATAPSESLWYGTVTLPEESINKSFRLVVKEYEVFLTGGSGHPKNRRLVYADIIEI